MGKINPLAKQCNNKLPNWKQKGESDLVFHYSLRLQKWLKLNFCRIGVINADWTIELKFQTKKKIPVF